MVKQTVRSFLRRLLGRRTVSKSPKAEGRPKVVSGEKFVGRKIDLDQPKLNLLVRRERELHVVCAHLDGLGPELPAAAA